MRSRKMNKSRKTRMRSRKMNRSPKVRMSMNTEDSVRKAKLFEAVDNYMIPDLNNIVMGYVEPGVKEVENKEGPAGYIEKGTVIDGLKQGKWELYDTVPATGQRIHVGYAMYQDGELHSEGGQPTIHTRDSYDIYYKNIDAYYTHGKLNSREDWPAWEEADQNVYRKRWYKNGVLYREGDRPNIELFDYNRFISRFVLRSELWEDPEGKILKVRYHTSNGIEEKKYLPDGSTKTVLYDEHGLKSVRTKI